MTGSFLAVSRSRRLRLCVARLLAVLTTAGPAGLTVTELLVATGRQKTWVYDRLADLQQASLVERAGQGRYRLSRRPTGGWEAMS